MRRPGGSSRPERKLAVGVADRHYLPHGPLHLGAMAHRDYCFYFVGQFLSVCGDWLQSTAMAVVAYHMTGQSTWPALLIVAQFLPSAALSSVGGALADRFPRRAILLWTQTALLLLAVGLGLVAVEGRLTLGFMLGMAALSGLIQAIDYPARMAFVKNLVGPDDLTSAVGLGALLLNGGRAVGPAIAAGVLSHFGPAQCFFGNAVSFAFVLLALALIANPGAPWRGC
ncbi:MAG: MFS transporter, partial [Candidatus Eremiobacterota bacterium]